MENSHTKKTIKAYDKNAQSYADKFADYKVYTEKILDFQSKFITNDADILDLGCGPANNIRTILKNKPGCKFTGVDLSKEFIKIAKKKFPQFKFIQQDIRNINISASYDIILASFCIVHLLDKEVERFLDRISHILRSEGVLYLSYMNGSNQGYESTSFSEEEIFFNYYDDQFIIAILKKNNFSVVEITKEEYLESNGSITTDAFIYAIKQ